ncbi:MAG: hypothetical protein J6N15_07945, partial [Ruminiclostridium sp.]|nr:hypothetical protein [Ruminiclostridium sp.]
EKADYPTGTGDYDGLKQYDAGDALGTVTMHNFRMNVDGQLVTGFCGDHSATMGNRFKGDKWDSPGPVSDNVYPLLAYYYWSCENDPDFDGGETGYTSLYTNSYIQCCIWLQKAGRLPDYRTDREGWINAVAEQRKTALAYYNRQPSETWTDKDHAAMILDFYESGKFGTGWEFKEYSYAGSSTENPQPVILGIHPTTTENKFYIKKVDTSGNNISGVTFRVESEDGSFSTTVTTDSHGEAEFESTAGDGWYSITELNAPSEYQRNSTPVRVYLVANVASEIRLANTKTETEPGSLKIRKVDIDDPNVGIAGAVIKLTHSQTGQTTTVQSGADGWAVIDRQFVEQMHTGLWIAEDGTTN